MVEISEPAWIFFTTHEQLVNGNSAENKEVYQYLMEAISFAKSAKAFGFYVINIFTGTHCLNAINVLSANNCRWRPLLLEPLTVENGISLLADVHPELASDMQTKAFKHFLLQLGNIPGLWREFSVIISDHLWDDNPNTE